MPKIIIDRFTTMEISVQRRYQLRRQRDGKCKICGEPCQGALLCESHAKDAAKHMRRLRKRRRSGAYALI